MMKLILIPGRSAGSSIFTQINQDYNLLNHPYYFGELSKTNVFIGENNSGKSRFLRYLFETDWYSLNEKSLEQFFIEMDRFIDSYGSRGCLNPIYRFYSTLSQSNIKRFIELYDKISSDQEFYRGVNYKFFQILQLVYKPEVLKNKFYFPVIRGTKDYKTIINNKLDAFLRSANSIQNKDAINHYISLLNLQSNGLESIDIYNDIIVQEYFKDNKKIGENILTGGKLYNEIKSMLLGEGKKRKVIEEFQKFLQENFFSNYDKVQLIPNEEKKVLYVKIGNDERAIYDWGDGTQQLIVILYSLYKHKGETGKLFFIEEPEMYLHPGILRKFIEVINSDVFENHQYFITTHSNIVLDTSADTNIKMSIFKFKKVSNINNNDGKPFLVEQCNNGDVSLLNELGVRNSSVFLSNCSIWVEGITDRLYLKHYLELYYKKNPNEKVYRENIDYTFIEYGGGNVVHFNFDEKIDDSNSINAKYINNKIFLIADNDNTKPGTKKASRKEKYSALLKDNFYELPVTEIENLITFETLKQILINQNPDKEEEICEVLSNKKQFSNKKLGKFIDELFPEGDIKRYAAESGTIKNKLEFCKEAINVMNGYDELSEEAKTLTEKIYKFISNNNKDN
ncbi:MAG: ATP-binding protein [Bacilli bacterium]|nr:ATP-binding protein [Bacilli bacterium]